MPSIFSDPRGFNTAAATGCGAIMVTLMRWSARVSIVAQSCRAALSGLEMLPTPLGLVVVVSASPLPGSVPHRPQQGGAGGSFMFRALAGAGIPLGRPAPPVPVMFPSSEGVVPQCPRRLSSTRHTFNAVILLSCAPKLFGSDQQDKTREE